MTDTDLLELELDRNPAEQTVRLALADRLREEGSPLADGYEAIARVGRHPVRIVMETIKKGVQYVWGRDTNYTTDLEVYGKCLLPEPWTTKMYQIKERDGRVSYDCPMWVYAETRREAEVMAARAWSALLAETRRIILERA